MRRNTAPGFLLATPKLIDHNFKKTVILLFQHDEEGAMGLVISHPTEYNLKSLLDEAGLDAGGPGLATVPVYVGGPVSPESGWLIFENDRIFTFCHGAASSGNEPACPTCDDEQLILDESFKVEEGLMISGSSDVFELFTGAGFPGRAIFCLGYAGWGPGQLDDELDEGDWLPVPMNRAILFGTKPEDAWIAAFRQAGIEPGLWSFKPGEA